MISLKSLFGGKKESEEQNNKKKFEILKYDGIRAQRMHKLAYAIKCFEEAILIEEDMETMGLLASTYTLDNRLDDAHALLERMTQKVPNEIEPLLSLASLCYMQEDYNCMEKTCQQAIALNKENPLAHFLAAKAYLGNKNDIMAIGMLTRAIVLKEDFTDALILRAEVLWRMKQTKDAAEDVQTLLRINPEDEAALLLKGEILNATEKKEEAIECLKQVLELNPFNEKAYLLESSILSEQKEYDKAIDMLNEAIDINPNFAKAYHERGRVKLLKGDKNGSIEDIKKAMELNPEEEAAIDGNYNNYDNLKKNVPF